MMIRTFARLGIFAAVLAATPLFADTPPDPVGRGDRYSGKVWATRSPVIARNGMAATSHPLASQVAVDVLKKGGSAVDAAIAANAVLGLMEPISCGIGGDLFAIVWDPRTKKIYGYNASGPAPAGRSFEQLITKTKAVHARMEHASCGSATSRCSKPTCR